MSAFNKPVEYAFTLPDGTTAYEIATSTQDVHAFTKMHRAVRAAPVAIDNTAAGKQTVLPGAEKIGDGAVVQRRAALPLRPKTAQRPLDIGLFSDDAKQQELFK